MEHRGKNLHRTKNGMKPESFDAQKVYDVHSSRSRGGKNNGVKRKLDSESPNEGRKRSKKEVLLTSLLSGKKKKRSVGQVGKAHLSLSSTDSGKAELGIDKKGSRGGADNGLSGISLKLDGNVYIPKRPRDLVRRKKFDVDLASNHEGVSRGVASLSNGNGKGSDNRDASLVHTGNSIGKSPQNGEPERAFRDGVNGNVKKEKQSDDHREISSNECDVVQHLESENCQSSVHKENSDSLIKKAKRLRKKVKGTRLAALRMSRGVKQFSNESSTIVDETQDDEENLEANAARMLSSRFDPSCTGFSSGGTIPKESFSNGLSPTISSNCNFDITHPTSLAESDLALSNGEAKALGTRDQQKEKSVGRKRRHFYEVVSRDFDCYWVLNRRIKVFWPLDKSWYIGHVTGYNPEKKLHHVKYDDRDEEWIDLQNEKFKLFLLPSEVPGKVGRKQSTAQDKYPEKGNRAETNDEKQKSNSCMESEPIISWLGCSNSHKSSPFGLRKRQRTQESVKSSLSLVCEGKKKSMESLEVNVSGHDVDNLVCVSAEPNNSHASMRDIKLLEHKVFSKNNGSHVVYFRRRFQKKGLQSSDIHSPDLQGLSREAPVFVSASEFDDSVDFGLDMLQHMVKCDCRHKNLGSDELNWDIDASGHLKLIIPITSQKALKCLLSLPVSFVSNNLLGVHRSVFLHQHEALVSVSRMVRLEMLFVDNIAGLRFLLFEGCLMQAVSFVFLVLMVFQSNHKESYFCQKLPVTSIRFQISGLRSLAKQLVFNLYYFTEVASSKWSYLDRKLSKHCVAFKQLPPSECTHGNILALQSGHQLPLTISLPRNHSSLMNIQKKPWPQSLSKPSKQSSFVTLSRVTSDSDGKLPSFAAAPKFFITLHLKLLMERTISSSSVEEQDLISLMGCSEACGGVAGVDKLVAKDNSMSCTVSLGVSSGSQLSSKSSLESCLFPELDDSLLSGEIDGVTIKPSRCSCDLPENEEILQTDNMTARITNSENCVIPEEHVSPNNKLSLVDHDIGCGPKANISPEIPSFISCESMADAELENVKHPDDLAVVSNDGVMCTPRHTPQISFHNCRNNGDLSPSTSACLSPGWSNRKQNFFHNGFGNGPRKPRTQVSYSMPLGGNDYNYKNNFHHGKGFSHKRIRRAKERKASDAGSSKRNPALLSCVGNCLVIVGDRGWRECGARVVLELVDHNDWRLLVKNSGVTKYSHKPHQFLQPGTTNRYTHAMMWKGGKDWILEFTDRSQWTTFKEMHEECYNRNLRAASVKNIPIPGVRLIEDNDDSVPEIPFMRPSSKYHRQLDTDIDIAMDPSRILYDMDSDDEQWLQRLRGLDFNDLGCGDVTDEMFEKTIDAFEKFAYVKQCDHFSLDELEDALTGFGPFNAVLNMYEHWREKRQKMGMPLIRHLQPPLWEKYQQQVKEWEQVVSAPSSGTSEKSSALEKPAMFAFCLKPRGLEVPNRGSKHRSQKKLSTGFLTNGSSGYPEYCHSPVGRSLNGFSLGDDRLTYSAYNEGASEHSPVLQRSIGALSPRDAGVSMGHFLLNNDGFERNYYSKPYRIKSKKLCFIPPSNDPGPSNNSRTVCTRSTGHMWNMGFSSDWPSQMNNQSEGFQRHSFDQVGPSELDEFRLRDAASAARHAVTVAKLKRENAQRMLCRADLAMQKAVAAIMTAEAVKASYVDPNNNTQSTR